MFDGGRIRCICPLMHALVYKWQSRVGGQQGSTRMLYTSYVRCCLPCAVVFPAACLYRGRSEPID